MKSKASKTRGVGEKVVASFRGSCDLGGGVQFQREHKGSEDAMQRLKLQG